MNEPAQSLRWHTGFEPGYLNRVSEIVATRHHKHTDSGMESTFVKIFRCNAGYDLTSVKVILFRHEGRWPSALHGASSSTRSKLPGG